MALKTSLKMQNGGPGWSLGRRNESCEEDLNDAAVAKPGKIALEPLNRVLGQQQEKASTVEGVTPPFDQILALQRANPAKRHRGGRIGRNAKASGRHSDLAELGRIKIEQHVAGGIAKKLARTTGVALEPCLQNSPDAGI